MRILILCYDCSESWLKSSSRPRRNIALLLVFLAMAPHMRFKELDLIPKLTALGKTAAEIRARLESGRKRRGLSAPSLNNVRLAMSGATYRRGGWA